MSNEFLSLLEMTKRAGTDQSIGIVEEVTNYAPEFSAILGRGIPGKSYTARVRSAVNTKGAFRNANEGVETGVSHYEQKQFGCFYFDSQMQVDEAILKGTDANGDTPEQVLADEANGAVRGQVYAFGTQFYKGTANDAKGFPGLIDFLNTTQVVNATGSGGTTYRAWYIWNAPQGIHFLFGNNSGLVASDWIKQQVSDSNSKKFMAMVANLSGYVGLSCAHSKAVGCVKNITSAAPLTDSMSDDLVATFPVGLKPNLVLMNRTVARYLQKSRSATSITNVIVGARRNDGLDIVPSGPFPTSVSGIPIIVTDSIVSEAAS